jgi:pyruvate/2-oxoglutarate/acetoin dehydrogenase E1 component
MAVLTMIQAIRAGLDEALGADPRVMIIGEDVGALGGVFRATDGLQAKYGEERIVDMPLAEAAIVGAALGLAVSGMRPIAEIQFLGFAHQAFHQIGQQVARMRYRSQGSAAVCARRSFTATRSKRSTRIAPGSKWCFRRRPTTRKVCSRPQSPTRTRCCSASRYAVTGS